MRELLYLHLIVQTTSAYTDQELFAAIATGDEEAFRTIFHKYNQLLFPFTISIVKSESDAREVMQNVFLKLWMNKEKLTTVDNPEAWLRTSTSNACVDFLRKQATYELHLHQANTMQSLSTEETIHVLDAREVKRAVGEVVQLLPLRRREIFLLSKIDGLSRKEIAEKLAISENTVKNQLGEAVAFVQEQLRKRNITIPILILLLITK